MDITICKAIVCNHSYNEKFLKLLWKNDKEKSKKLINKQSPNLYKTGRGNRKNWSIKNLQSFPGLIEKN